MSNEDARYLVIDQGGHASRAVIFDPHGNTVAHAEQPVATRHPAADRVEQDPEELIDSIQRSITGAVEQLGQQESRPIAAGLASQRSSIVCWDRRNGRPLSAVISWQDRRQQEWLQQFASRAEWIQRRTGLTLNPHYGASKLRWCLEHLKQVAQAGKAGHLALGPVAGFYLFRLLDEHPHLIDPANAGRTQLWNIGTGDWDPELLALFDIPAAALPHCVTSAHEFGTLALDDMRVPLTLLMGDQSAALYAHGRPDARSCYVNIGTGAFIQVIQRQPSTETTPFLHSIVYRDAEITDYAIEGTVNGAGSALEWLRVRDRIDDLFGQLPAWLHNVDQPPLFINAISGLGAPFWVADLESRFIGTSAEPGARAVAVVESIVFLIAENINGISKLAQPPEHIVVSGGLAALSGLCQRLADVTGLAVVRPGVCEATARGCAFLLAGQPDDWPAVEPVDRFRPKANPALRVRYRQWQTELRRTVGS